MEHNPHLQLEVCLVSNLKAMHLLKVQEVYSDNKHNKQVIPAYLVALSRQAEDYSAKVLAVLSKTIFLIKSQQFSLKVVFLVNSSLKIKLIFLDSKQLSLQLVYLDHSHLSPKLAFLDNNQPSPRQVFLDNNQHNLKLVFLDSPKEVVFLVNSHKDLYLAQANNNSSSHR